MVALFVQDSNQLVNGTQLRQQQDGTTYSLVLTDVAPQDAGVYTCVAQNAGGQVLCKAELLVYGGELTDSSPALSLHRESSGVHSWLPILYMSCALTVGDKSDAEKQAYRRKLHSFYEVQEEIGRYLFLACPTISSPSQDTLSMVPTKGPLSPSSPPGVCLVL